MFCRTFQAPGKKRKRRHSSSARRVAPPEDLIEEFRRKEILVTFQAALESYNEGGTTPKGKLLPIDCMKKLLKKLRLVRSICFWMLPRISIEPTI